MSRKCRKRARAPISSQPPLPATKTTRTFAPRTAESRSSLWIGYAAGVSLMGRNSPPLPDLARDRIQARGDNTGTRYHRSRLGSHARRKRRRDTTTRLPGSPDALLMNEFYPYRDFDYAADLQRATVQAVALRAGEEKEAMIPSTSYGLAERGPTYGVNVAD
ncbi:hypothetical protein DL765_003630 [Monosporascus sp. GIB2]|nr:hypothetical protein DL765_003630 [Monosporascus sp. GIB2]